MMEGKPWHTGNNKVTSEMLPHQYIGMSVLFFKVFIREMKIKTAMKYH